MRRIVFALLLPVALMAQAPAPAPLTNDAEAVAKRTDIRKLLVAMHVGEVGSNSLRHMANTMKATSSALPEAFWDEYAAEATPEKLVEVSVPVYEKNLSHDEVKAYLAFVATPEGASIMSKMPQIASEATEVGVAFGKQLVADVKKKLKAEGKM